MERTRTRPSLWYRENRDSSLKIQCLHCLRSHTLCLLSNSRWRRLCSKVSLGHLAPPKSADHLHSQTRSQDEAIRSDHSEQLIVFPWHGDFYRTCTLPLMWWASLSVALHNFSYVSLRHPQHPRYFLAENCHLPTTWQFAAVFAVANFVVWSPFKVQRNINNLLQVTTPELTFFFFLSLSGPATILTVFSHSVWLCDGLVINSISLRNWIYNQKQ